MRLITAFCLALLLTPAIPAGAQEAETPLVTEKIAFLHSKARDFLLLLYGRASAKPDITPDGIRGVLAYELDNSLLVRGTAASIQRLKAGARVADVAISRQDDQDRVLLRPIVASPAALTLQVRRLPGAGTATPREDGLELVGSAEWVRLATRTVIAAEMKVPLDDGSPAKIELTFPAGTDLRLVGDRVTVTIGADASTVTLDGKMTIRTRAGFRLETRGHAVITGLSGGPVRVVIEPAADQP